MQMHSMARHTSELGTGSIKAGLNTERFHVLHITLHSGQLSGELKANITKDKRDVSTELKKLSKQKN